MNPKEHWFYLILATAALLGFGLSGCAGNTNTANGNDTVHLHANTLSQGERNAVRNALVAEGFNVKIHSTPSPFDENTLIYHPFIGSDRQIEKVRLALEETEQAAENLRLRQARNHHYTSHNIGLYLHSEHKEAEANQSALPDIPLNVTDLEFISRECEDSYTLEFYHDGTAEIWGMHSDTPLANLRWREATDRVTLESDEKTYHYRKDLITRRDGSKTTSLIVLSTDREAVDMFGCKYQGRMTEHGLDR